MDSAIKKYLCFVSIFAVFLIYMIIAQQYLVKPDYERTLIVGTNATYPPFCFYENNEIVGLDIDVVKEVACRLGYNTAINDMSFDALLPGLQMGSLHIVAAGMTPTTERAKQVFFATPHYQNEALVAVTSYKHAPIQHIEQLYKERIVVCQGYMADIFVTSLENLNILRLDTLADALLALDNNRADVFIDDSIPVKRALALHPKLNFVIWPLPHTTQVGSALTISRAYPELFEPINDTLIAMKNDGTLTSFLEKWGL